MRNLFKYITLWLALAIATICNAQIKNVGIPNIVNHTRSEYNASTQNWSITQTSNGFMYFGNNDGILEYDGTNWQTYTVPNLSVVRSVLAIGDTVYIGAFEEIGFLAPNRNGKIQYNSLKHLIPESYRNFDEIWNIYKENGTITFQSFNYIFKLSKGKVTVIEPLSKFSMLHKANGKHYIVDVENGLMIIEKDSLVTASNHPIFFRNEIRCIIPLSNGNLLIGTSNEGLFLFDERISSISPWNSDVNKKIKENNLFSAINLSNGNLALGSVRNGIYICNQDGRILQHLNRYKGLQNNTVLSLFEDRKNNLWLGLDNGIDYFEVSSPISFLNYNNNIESAYSTIVHNGIMYVGTNQGLYAKKFSDVNNSNPNTLEFKLIKGTEGQVWTLSIFDKTLFCGHNYGCFVVDGYSAKQISTYC